MAELIDLRPDRFLREVREQGDAYKACITAGFTLEELKSLIQENEKFRISVVECLNEWGEDIIMQEYALQRGIIDKTYRKLIRKLDRETATRIQEVRDVSSI